MNDFPDIQSQLPQNWVFEDGSIQDDKQNEEAYSNDDEMKPFFSEVLESSVNSPKVKFVNFNYIYLQSINNPLSPAVKTEFVDPQKDSRAFNYDLIKSVEQHPALFDTGNEGYKLIEVRNRQWEEIAMGLGQPGFW